MLRAMLRRHTMVLDCKPAVTCFSSDDTRLQNIGKILAWCHEAEPGLCSRNVR